MVKRNARWLPIVLGVLLLFTGCTVAPGLAVPDRATTWDNTITEITPAKRGKPVVFGGNLADGTVVDSRNWIGSPVVVNFWYASCPPCRAEAPDLVALDGEFKPQGVVFIGVNVRDQAGTVDAFDREFTVPYPSILDTKSGSAQLAFAGQIAPDAVPTTVVLDRKGRVAARIIGRIPARSILRTLIEDVVKEGAAP